MQKPQSYKHFIIYIAAFCAVFILFTAVATAENALAPLHGFKFFGYQLAAVLLPGIAITLLLKIKQLDLIQFLAISYTFGFFLNIVEYFVLYPFGLQAFAPWLVLLVCAIAIFILIKYRQRFSSVAPNHMAGAVCLLLLGIYLFCGFLNAMRYISPRIFPHEVLYGQRDMLYWIENTISLTKAFPPIDLRINGFIYKYHYFSSVQIAFMHGLVGGSVFELSTCFSYVAPSVMLVGMLYTLFKDVTGKMPLTLLAVFILLLTAGKELDTYINPIMHTLIVPFGYDYGLAAGAMFLFFLHRAFSESVFNGKLCTILGCTMALLTGLRSPIAVIALAIAGALCFGWLLQRKWKQALLYGGAILGAFLLIYLLLHAGKVDAVTTVVQPLSVLINKPHSFTALYNTLRMNGLPAAVALPMVGFLWLISSHFFIIPAAGLAALLLLYRKKADLFELALGAGALFGLTLTLLLRMQASAEVYFFVAAIPVFLLFAMRVFSQAAPSLNITGPVHGGVYYIGGISLFLSVIYFIVLVSPYLHTGKTQWDISRAYRAGHTIAQEEPLGNPHAITQGKYAALDWVRQNVPESAVLLVDSGPTAPAVNPSFYYGVFSERQMYIEDSYLWPDMEEAERRNNLTIAAFQNDRDALAQVLAEGVTHIVQTQAISPAFTLPAEYGRIVFENDEITVFEVA